MAAPNADDKTIDAMTRYAKTSNMKKGITDMIALARSEPGVPILPQELDTDPWLLNVASGTIDLKTAVLRPHRLRGSLCDGSLIVSAENN